MKDLRDFARSKNLREPDLLTTCLHLTINFTLFFAGFALITQKHQPTLSFLVAQIFFCVSFFKSFALMHEAVHGTLFKNKNLNNLFGIVCSILCFLPFEPWRRVHLDHHKWNGNLEKDPVLKIVKDFKTYSSAKKKFLDFSWRSWLPLMAGYQQVVFWMLSLSYLKKDLTSYTKVRCLISFAAPLLFWTGALWSGKLLLFTPSFLMYLFLTELINFPHHLGLTNNLSNKPTPYDAQHIHSRSCHYPKWFARLVLCNFNLHTAHHLFPNVPFHNLQMLEDQLEIQRIHGRNSSKTLTWVLENRVKKIEDVFYPKIRSEKEESKVG